MLSCKDIYSTSQVRTSGLLATIALYQQEEKGLALGTSRRRFALSNDTLSISPSEGRFPTGGKSHVQAVYQVCTSLCLIHTNHILNFRSTWISGPIPAEQMSRAMRWAFHLVHAVVVILYLSFILEVYNIYCPQFNHYNYTATLFDNPILHLSRTAKSPAIVQSPQEARVWCNHN